MGKWVKLKEVFFLNFIFKNFLFFFWKEEKKERGKEGRKEGE